MLKITFSILLFFICIKVFSQSNFELINEISEKKIGKNYLSFEDISGKYTESDIGKADFEKNFQYKNPKKAGFIYSKANIWAKINVQNCSEKEWLLELDNPTIDTVEFYLVQNNRIISHQTAGDHQPFSSYTIKSANPISPLKLTDNKPFSIYIKGNSTEELDFDMTIWDKNALYEHLSNRQLFWGIFFGFIIVISLYNFFLWLTTKHLTYLSYVIYVLSFGLFQASLYGFGHQYIWDNHPFNEKAHITFFGISITFLTLFTLHFLDIFKHYPASKKYFKIGGIIWFIAMMYIIATFNAASRFFIVAISGIALVLQMFYSTRLFLKGNRAVLFYMLATFAFSLAGLIIILKNFVNWFPGDFYLKLGSMIEMVLFSVALGDKYRYIEKETLRQQKIRSDIASNLHDDLAASLSSLTMYSELNRLKSQKTDPNLKGIFENISARSRDMMRQVREAVWEIKPENDASDEWLDRIIKYANDTLEPQKIDFIANISSEMQKLKLPIDVRRNVYFIFKEAINNAAKYAEARSVKMDFFIEKKEIVLKIVDNGKGFDKQEKMNGNGLPNFQKRAKEIKGKVEIRSSLGNGTEVRLRFPLK